MIKNIIGGIIAIGVLGLVVYAIVRKIANWIFKGDIKCL